MTQRRLILGPVAAGLALVLTALPVTPDLGTAGFDSAAALAKNGGGNGNGNGGGNGNGNGGGKGDHGKDSHQATGKADAKADKAAGKGSERGGKSSGRGLALGHDKDKDAVGGVGRDDDDEATSHGLTASSLGRLNAAHASPTARANAAPHSAVGLMGQYVDAVEADDLEAAAAALAAAANKDIDLAVVGAVDDLLGLEVDEETEQEIADLASDLQDDDDNNGLGNAEGGPSPDGDDDGDEDGDEIE